MELIYLPPKVSHNTHYLINGVIWLFAGINLVRIAIGWYLEENMLLATIGLIFTIILSILISKTRFKNIASKFISHIKQLPDRSWFFAFQKVRHYVLLGSMIMLGIFFREYSGLDNYILALIYTTMGSTLVFTSYYFFNRILIQPNQEAD